MAISKLFKHQVTDKRNELVKQLQAEARILFYDHMMYDINDSLTSILAVCEVEPKEAIPKIKQYIHRINQSLHETKSYQKNHSGERKFNITLVLQNLLRVIDANYKGIKLTCLVSDIKAPVQGDQSRLEELLFYIFVNLLPMGSVDNFDILIELRQKDQDAMITILKDHYTFPKEALEKVNKLQEEDGFNGKLQITPRGQGVEMIIKIPLQFRVVNITKPTSKNSSSNSRKHSTKKEGVSRGKADDKEGVDQYRYGDITKIYEALGVYTDEYIKKRNELKFTTHAIMPFYEKDEKEIRKK